MAKILVVNNDIDTMSMLKAWLQKRTYDVKYTADGGEVAKMMKEFSPDLVLVDVMQDEAAAAIKNSEKTSLVPVLMMTGYANGKVPDRSHCDDTIEKPFDLKLLQNKIERLLR